MISSCVDSASDTISFLALKDLPEPETPRMNALPLRSCLRSATMRFLLMAFCPYYTPPRSQISWALKGMRTASASVVRVRRASMRRRPSGSAVTSPSACCQFSIVS